jgi:hypothetical protein
MRVYKLRSYKFDILWFGYYNTEELKLIQKQFHLCHKAKWQLLLHFKQTNSFLRTSKYASFKKNV